MKRVYTSFLLLFAALLSGALSGRAQTTFSTPGTYTYTVTGTTSSIAVDMAGAKGGDNSDWPSSGPYPSQGGNGGRVLCTLAVTPGQVLTIYVGGLGGNGTTSGTAGAAGYNGGGAGSYGYSTYAGGGGGGASDIRTGAAALTDRVIVAAGGGGAGLDNYGTNLELGGYGGGLVGENGYFNGTNTFGDGGGGGTQIAGGTAGSGSGGNGSFGVGGDVGAIVAASGGGGGGYYGGGAGGYSWSAGGGGSSYYNGAGVTAGSTTPAFNAADGYVTLTPLCNVAGTIAGPSALCLGSGATFTDATGSTGGTWVSSNTAIATIDPSTGAVTTVSPGVDTITYMVSNLCTGTSATATLTVNALPSLHTISGGGSYCSGGTGVNETLDGSDLGVSYQLYNGIATEGTAMAGSGAPINFGNFTDSGSYTVVATDTTTTCTSVMTGTDTITIIALPVAYTVTGGGLYCAGGTGVAIGLSSSDTGVKYQLFYTSTASGSPVAGTESAISFGLQTVVAPYTVMATDTITGCINSMLNSVSVSTNPLPVAYTVTGGGAYCSADTGLHIGLINSNTGVSYQLYNGVTAMGGAVAGTGSHIDMGLETMAGSYTVVATNNTTGCMNNMSNAVSVIINPSPAIYTVSAGGSYCAGGTGVHVTLDSSNFGINYQLYYGTTATGSPVTGIDTMLDLGAQTAAGTYTVVATDTMTGCMSNMAGGAIITITPVVIPTVSLALSTSDTICAGTTTTFTATGTHGGSTPAYMWTVNGVTVGTDSNAYAYVPANADIISVSYTSSAACAMPGTVSANDTIFVWPNVFPSITLTATPGDTVCVGTGVVVTATPSYGGYTPSFYWIKNTTPVSNTNSYSFTPDNGDAVYCIMGSSYMCALSTVAFSLPMTFDVEAIEIPVVSITGNPGITLATGRPDTLIAHVTNGGDAPAYQWYINTLAVPGATNSSFIQSTFNNGDSVSVLVTRADACHMSTINSVVIHVSSVGVATTMLNSADISLVPNPNKGAFTIKGSLGTDDQDVTIEVMNIVGQVVYKSTATAHNGILNEQVTMSNTLANGTYMLNLHTASGANSIIRFVVE